MRKWYYLMFLMVFLLTACVHHEIKVASEVPQAIKTTQIRGVTAFNQMDVQGQINVSLHSGYKQPRVILKGDTRDLTAVKVEVSNHTLYVILGKGYPHYGPVEAVIEGQYLTRLIAKDTPVITGTQLHTPILDVYLQNTGTVRLGGSIGLRILDIRGTGFTQMSGLLGQSTQIRLQGSPKVQLLGMTNLSKLTMQGTASLSMYWVKADRLTIRAENAARIQLAGVVNRLDVVLWGNAQFKGRYLRAQRSFVKTHGHASAEISVAKHQSNSASGASDIYYYNLPTTRADFMVFDGSVLDMREWSQSELKDFNRYNKQFP